MQIICLDIEATGLNNETEDIIEIAAVKFSLLNDETETFHHLIHTDIEIPNLIQNLTGINNDMLKDAPKLETIQDELIKFCGDLPILGHNIQFDTGFLRQKGVEIPGTEIDTLPLSQAILKHEPSFSLEILCSKYNKSTQPSHRALDDVLANIELLKILIQKLNQAPEANKLLLKQILQKSTNSLSPILLEILNTLPEKEPNFAFKTSAQQETYQVLHVTNTDLLDPSAHPNILPKPNTLIDQNQLLTALLKLTPDEVDADFEAILKIALKINPNHLTYTQLNHRGTFPLFLKQAIQPGTPIPFSADKYICDYHTFFELYKTQTTDKFQEIIIDPDPYLVEGYLHTKEVKINIDKIEANPEDEINLLKTFNQIEEFLHSKITDQNSTYKYHVLDMFDKSSPEFQAIIKELSNLTQNTQTKSELQVFNKLQSSYYIWMEQFKEYPVQIKAIPKTTLINQKEILSNIKHPNIQLPTHTKSDQAQLNTISHQADTRTQEYTNFIIHYLKQNFMDITHTGLVISPTKQLIKQIHENLSLEFKDKGITILSQDLTGSKGKIIQLLESNESPTLLVCTHHFLLKFQPELAKLEKALLAKLPIGLPAHKIYRILEKEDDNSFGNLVIPQTAATIGHILSLLHSKYKLNQLDNLDYRIQSTGWGRKIGDNI
jgi:DNA polymerase III epsilon subunit-like protein